MNTLRMGMVALAAITVMVVTASTVSAQQCNVQQSVSTSTASQAAAIQNQAVQDAILRSQLSALQQGRGTSTSATATSGGSAVAPTINQLRALSANSRFSSAIASALPPIDLPPVPPVSQSANLNSATASSTALPPVDQLASNGGRSRATSRSGGGFFQHLLPNRSRSFSKSVSISRG